MEVVFSLSEASADTEGLKFNNAKFEIAGIGVKQGVKMKLWEMECIDFTDDIIKFSDI